MGRNIKILRGYWEELRGFVLFHSDMGLVGVRVLRGEEREREFERARKREKE